MGQRGFRPGRAGRRARQWTGEPIWPRWSAPGPRWPAPTTFDVDEYLFGALQAGAVGFLLKDSDGTLYAEAVRAAYAGQGLLDPQVTHRLVRHFADTSPRPPTAVLARLTERETDVLRCLARGMSNAGIGLELGVSACTAKVHVARVLAKLDVGTRAQAAVYAYRHGLVTFSDDG